MVHVWDLARAVLVRPANVMLRMPTGGQAGRAASLATTFPEGINRI